VLLRVDDQRLVDIVGGVERELLPGLIAGGDDLHDERGCGLIHAPGTFSMQTASGNAIVVWLSEAELTDQRLQASRSGQWTEQPSDLLDNSLYLAAAGWIDMLRVISNLAMTGDVVDTFPNLIVVATTPFTPPLEQLSDL
jgi:hypothetical protein